MKKNILLTLLAITMVMNVAAQNRSINFEQTKEWKKIIKKAKKAKKLIFVDCYTSWCGPCKTLDKKVFTQDKVADFFNQHFINAKYDMEKDAEGVKLKPMFEVRAFPTLLFVDPSTQQVVHRLVGAGSAEWLIAGAKRANDPQKNFIGMMERYKAGERSSEFLTDYLSVLGSAYMHKEKEVVAMDYLNLLSSEQLATKENWELIKKNVTDPLSPPLKKVMADRDKFYLVANKEEVDKKLATSITSTVMQLTMLRPDMKTNFDEQGNTDLVNYLLSVDDEAIPAALANLYTAAYVRKGDFKGMLDKMHEVFSYNIFRKGSDAYYFQRYISALALCDDKALLEEGILWIDKRCNNALNYFVKADLMEVKARLQTKNGDTLGAEQSKEKEKEYAEEGKKRSGGRMMRAMKMR